ncbi:MAG: AIR synthase related protein, partial [Candidatus Dormibacteraeota bacterium]|nr:AIR synthase related protein [Candidatus Dormibacteraeota bacterium]
SESQERMLIVVQPERKAEVDAIFEKYDLHADVIGRVTESGRLTIRDGGSIEADIPVPLLVDEVPFRHPQGEAPRARLELRDRRVEVPELDLREAFLRVLGSPNIGSRRGVFRTYDHQVQNNTVIPPGGDAALLRVKGTGRGIAVTTDGNGRYCYLDPRAGAAIAVAEAARNIVATGATPAAVTDCLNFGNPEKPEVFWELKECIEGMAQACRELELPVVSGNVSLYNDTSGVSIYPSPVVGMVGVIEDIEQRLTAAFKNPGDVVLLIGPTAADLGGSEFQKVCLGEVAGRPPALDMGVERASHAAVLEAAAKGLLNSCHDLADGGLAIAFAESCLLGATGGRVTRLDAVHANPALALFSESQSRFLLSCAPGALSEVKGIAARHGVAVAAIGEVGGADIALGEAVIVPLDLARQAWGEALS